MVSKANVKVEFSSGAVIDLEGDDCIVKDRLGDAVTLSRAEVLRFVHTFVANEMEQACGDQIGSRALVSDERFEAEDEEVTA